MPLQFAPILARVGMEGAGFAAKSPLANMVSGASFGAPYAFSTYVGFPGNYQRKSYKGKVTKFESDMPSGRGYANRRKTFSYRWSRWFNTRVWSRKYRRTIYIHRNRY